MVKKKEKTEKYLKNLGKRIRDLRIQKGYTNYEIFAYEKGISRSQYGKYETGSEDLRFSSLIRIVEAHEMSLSEFFSEGFKETT